MRLRCSYFQWISLLTIGISSVSWGGNESGGDWIANRYIGYAYEGLSIICREVEQKRSKWTLEEIVLLEKAISDTPVSSAKDAKALIPLERERWVSYFDVGLDIREEVLEPYVKRAGIKKAIFEGVKLKGPEKPLVVRDGSVLFILSPELKNRKDAEYFCADQEGSLPTRQEISASLEKIRKLDEWKGYTPRHLQVRPSDGENTYDLLLKKDYKITDETPTGVLCVKRR